MSSAGLLPSIFFVPGSDPLGTVEQQAKAAGAKLAYHAHVQINVASGTGDKPKETVPNVIGKTLQDAVSSLNAAHHRLIFVKLPVTVRSQAGKIAHQSPLGGNHAPQNAQELVFLGAYRG
jgi:beta-lactam-binding protein with PASTA domain